MFSDVSYQVFCHYMAGAMLLSCVAKLRLEEDPCKAAAFAAGSPYYHLDFVILHYTIGFAFARIFAKD